MTNKISTKNYNITDLDPETTFNRHVFHRDQFAHYLRWTHILKETKVGETIVDFGCGKGNLLEVLYRNKLKCEKYVGLDIRKQTIDKANEKYNMVNWASFAQVDLVKPNNIFETLKGDRVCSFEVAEHVGKQNIDIFLQNFKSCGKSQATYYLSTPNHDEKVGAAGNHTYDSGDGRGIANQEFTYDELKIHLEKYFIIKGHFGTFASQKDYKPIMNQWQTNMFDELCKYYDSNLVSNLMAPFFPKQSRNILWILNNK